MRARTITGAGVVCKVNGLLLGRVTSLEWSIATPRKPIYGIDSFTPQELLTGAVKISGRLQIVRTTADGGAEGAGIVAGLPDLSREHYFSLQLIERASDSVVFEAWYASCESQSWTAPERGVIKGTLEFSCLDARNELNSITN